ncbi:MAG: hypothetical protein Q4C12_05845 [Clostridia bacterium]|nr:hypothetical protein [Clostridia bacterium]
MRKYIHGETIRKYLKDALAVDVEIKKFRNNISGESNYVFYNKKTDLAVFSEKGDGKFACFNSNGDSVDINDIYGYAHEDEVKREDSELLFKTDTLSIRIGDSYVQNDYISNMEEEIYPDRTNIVLNAMFTHNHFTTDLTSFYVDEIVYASDEEFDSIRQGYDSELLEEYNKKHYEKISDGVHGIVVIGDNGDGLLIDTQGFDYARYMSYAPHIKDYIDTAIENEMAQKAKLEMKLYVPLTVTVYDEEYDDEKVIDGSMYSKEIREKIRTENRIDGNRGLAEYFWSDEKCKNKVYSIKPDVEFVHGVMMGVAVIKMTKPLNNEELDSLKDYVTGQFSDAWGESFEQHEISVSGGEIYVHFWNSENYYIKTEQELNEAEQEQGMEMNMNM